MKSLAAGSPARAPQPCNAASTRQGAYGLNLPGGALPPARSGRWNAPCLPQDHGVVENGRARRVAFDPMNPGSVRVGVSGWRYEPWRGVFYPKGLLQKNELQFASRKMRTIEINGSFYALQRPSSYLRWYGETPDDFVFAVKGGRFLTHNKKLRDCRQPLANFLGSGVLALEEKLGPILWQLPPQLPFDPQRLEDFFGLLPGSTGAAAEMARRHDHRVKYGTYADVKKDRPLRYALEVRHESYDDPAFVRVLRKHGVALVVADSAGRFPCLEEVTADFVYVRLHGAK